MLLSPGRVGRVGFAAMMRAILREKLPKALSSDSVWNTALPATPAVHATSANIVATIVGWGAPSTPAAGVYGTADDFDVPIYQASRFDPQYTINVTGAVNARSLQLNGTPIRLPVGAAFSTGSDHHLVVVQPDGWAYEFWEGSTITGGVISATAAGRFRWQGDGFDNSNAFASKTAAAGGLITPEELAAGVVDHAIGIVVKATPGTNVWPASGNALGGGGVDSPANGQWLRYNRTWTEIDADALANGWPRDCVTILKALSKYGGIVHDTGSATWNVRFVGDASTASIGGGQPMRDHAVANLNNGWFEYLGKYYLSWPATVNWAAHWQVLEVAQRKTAYEAQLAYKKLDPIATVRDVGPWTKTGAATIDTCLIEAVYAPFAPTDTLRIGTNTVGRIAEVRVETLAVPQGKKLKSLYLAYYGNTGAACTYAVRLKSAATVLGSYTQPENQIYGWRFVTFVTDGSGLNLADIRMEFEYLSGTVFSNITQAYVMAEIVDAA